MTPEEYVAAVKACPRAAWLTKYPLSRWGPGEGELLWRGYATRFYKDQVEVVGDYVLSSKTEVLSRANASIHDRLSATARPAARVFLGEIPHWTQLRALYVSKHGKLRGLDWLFPYRIDDPAAKEWLHDQFEKQRADREKERAKRNEQQVRDLLGALLLYVRRAPRYRNVWSRV